MQPVFDIFPLVKILQIADTTFGIPQDFEHFVPEEGRKPFWLFTGHNFRYEFFRRNRNLVNILNTLSRRTALRRFEIHQRINSGNFDINHPLQLALLQDFSDTRQLIQLALSLAEARHIHSFYKLFKRQSYLFLKQWQEKLLVLNAELLQQQIRYVITIVRYLKICGYQLNFVKNQIIIDSRLVHEMYRLCVEIKCQLSQSNIDQQLLEEFQIAEEFYGRVINSATALVNLLSTYCEVDDGSKGIMIANKLYSIDQAIAFAVEYLTTERERDAVNEISNLMKMTNVNQLNIGRFQNCIHVLFKSYKNPRLEIEKFINTFLSKFGNLQ